MAQAIRITVPVLPGKRIEFASTELPEEGDVELVVYLPQAAEPALTSDSIHSARYPQSLNAEYASLIAIPQTRSMTTQEQIRLQQIMDEINAIDASNGPATRRGRTLTAIADDLSAVRKALEQRAERR